MERIFAYYKRFFRGAPRPHKCVAWLFLTHLFVMILVFAMPGFIFLAASRRWRELDAYCWDLGKSILLVLTIVSIVYSCILVLRIKDRFWAKRDMFFDNSFVRKNREWAKSRPVLAAVSFLAYFYSLIIIFPFVIAASIYCILGLPPYRLIWPMLIMIIGPICAGIIDGILNKMHDLIEKTWIKVQRRNDSDG